MNLSTTAVPQIQQYIGNNSTELVRDFSLLFPGYRDKKMLKRGIVYTIITDNGEFIVKIVDIGKNTIREINQIPNEVFLLFIINDLAQDTIYLTKWVANPIVFPDRIDHPSGRKKIRDKLLFFYEMAGTPIDKMIMNNKLIKQSIKNVHSGIITLQKRMILHMDLKIDNVVYDKIFKLIDYDEAVTISQLKDQQIRNHFSDKILDIRAFTTKYRSLIKVERLTVENSALLYDLYFFLGSLLIYCSDQGISNVSVIIKHINIVERRLIQYRPCTPKEVENIFKSITSKSLRSRQQTLSPSRTLRSRRLSSPRTLRSRRQTLSPRRKTKKLLSRQIRTV